MEHRFDEVCAALIANHPEADAGLVERAFRFSEAAHAGQKRASGEPYVTHPLDVAFILAHDLRLDAPIVAAGLLHDVIEDTHATRDELEAQFGPEVASIVEGLTKLDKYEFSSKAEAEAENFRKMLLAIAHDVRVILVKLADRLHNMRTLGAVADEKQRRKALETLEIYAPLAHRLGMGRVKEELEDLGFRYSYPEAWKGLSEKLGMRKNEAGKLIDEIEGSLRALIEKSGVKCEVSGRVKRLYSIYRKQTQRGSDDVFDFLAFRVLVPTLADCYQILGLAHGKYTPLPGRFKDYIAIPKNNLYQSLHTTVLGPGGHPFELQIRTFEMHELAEEGIAAHWKYKSGKGAKAGDEERFRWLKTMVEAAQGSPGAQQFMESVKGDLYPDEVYAFTPKGEIKVLPREATALDFAFAVHSKVGERTQGVKINGRLLPISTPVRSGDIVEVITSTHARPHRDWLQFVKTPRAIAKIRHTLALEEKERNLDAGRLLLERELKKLDHPPDESAIMAVSKKLGIGDLPTLHAAIGFGKILPKALIEKVLGMERKPVHKPAPLTGAAGPILVEGMGDILTYRAGCCKPIKGEPIVGVITRGKGVAIHSQLCKNLKSGVYQPERWMPAEWSGEGPAHGEPQPRYEAQLRLISTDRPGILAAITAALADLKLNIRAISGGGAHGRGQIDLTVDTPSIEELHAAATRIRKIPGIESVERVVR